MDKETFFARTMHTPDDPARATLRASLRELSKNLLPLHRALINAARDDYNFAFGDEVTPNRLMQLMQEDPFFAWLKPVTSVIVDIDEMARVDFEAADYDAIVARVDRLFGTKVDGDFAEKYVPILQRDVDVAIAHAALRPSLAKLRGD
ncbi:MAG TPA: hypothetical protein VGJ81_21845 [Thermoanaerobaculia bacterium]|jgi:hypothetical protein